MEVVLGYYNISLVRVARNPPNVFLSLSLSLPSQVREISRASCANSPLAATILVSLLPFLSHLAPLYPPYWYTIYWYRVMFWDVLPRNTRCRRRFRAITQSVCPSGGHIKGRKLIIVDRERERTEDSPSRPTRSKLPSVYERRRLLLVRRDFER